MSMAAVIAAAPWVSNSLAGSSPSGRSRWVGSRSAAVRCQKAFCADFQPAGSESVATAMRSRPSTMSMWARSSLIWLTVSAVPMGGAMPTAVPLLPRVMASASMGALDDDRERAVGERFAGLGVPEECLALGEDRGGAGVEVLRSGVVVVGLVGVAAADEAEDRLPARVMGGVADGHDESVAEEVAVVRRAVVAFTLGDEAGLLQLVGGGGSLLGEVPHQAAATSGCVPPHGVGGVVGEVGP